MKITLRLFIVALASFLSLEQLYAQCSITINDFPYKEGFEDNLGNWTGDVNTGAGILTGSWNRNSGGTTSGSTGPTGANEGSFYVYTETSAPNGGPLDTYRLVSPCFSIPNNSAPWFSFDYHMLANSDDRMGYLFLEVDSNLSGNWDTLWFKYGTQGSNWLSDSLDLGEYENKTIKLRFTGISGSNTVDFWQGDRAIDNLYLSLGYDHETPYCIGGEDGSISCEPFFGVGGYTYLWSTGSTSQSIEQLSTGSYTVTISDSSNNQRIVVIPLNDGNVLVENQLPYNQSWEDGLSGWFNDSIGDDFDWTINSGTTPTGPTGPLAASHGVDYIYTESSFLSGFDLAILNSPCFDFPESTAPYMIFDYHMRVQGFGGSASDMGSLWIIADTTPKTLNTGDTIWEQIGASGNNWLTDTIDLSAYAGNHLTLRFSGQLSNGISQYGDRAIDNIRIRNAIEVQESCSGLSGGSIILDPQYGISPYSYLWSTGSTASTITNLSAGTYTVTITDANSSTQVRQIPIDTAQLPPTPSNLNASQTEFCENALIPTNLSVDFLDSTLTYSITSSTQNDLGTAFTVGESFNTQINDVFPFASGDATITVYYRGDVEAPGEYVQVFSENGTLLATGNDGVQQCGALFNPTSFNVSADSINSWILDNQLEFESNPIGMTRYCGTGGTRFSLETYYVITYPYSPFKTYWFENSCNNNPTNAIDSGYIIQVNPNTTTTFYSRNYDSYCDTWGECESIEITVNTPPTVNITPPAATICNNNGQNLTASGANSYSWSPGAGLNTSTGSTVFANPSSTTTYTVVGSDNNGCNDTTDVTVTLSPDFTITSTSSSPTCVGGSNGSASVSVSGTTAPYSYLWSTGSTNTSISGLSSGTYTVSVTDSNGCLDTETVTITAPAASFSVSLGEQTSISCNGGTTNLIAFFANGSPSYTYNWSQGGGGTTTNFFIASGAVPAGTYTITVTDGNGCSDSDSVVVNEPSPLVLDSVIGTDLLCNNDNSGTATAHASGGTTPYTYNWIPSGTGATISGLSAGTYTVALTDANGCTPNSTPNGTSVTLTEPPAIVITFNGISNVTCFGGNDGEATVSATGGVGTLDYLWPSGATSTTVNNLTAGTHTVTVTDDNGCTDTASVTIIEPTELIAAATVDDNVSCNGGNDGQATASASGGTPTYSYLWSSGATTATASNLSAGTYTVTVTDDNGCTDSASITITEPALLVASATLDNNVSCNGGNDGEATASATAGTPTYSYLWSSGATTATASNLSAGTYTVTVTDD
ncbi:MAG: hypothetical protein WEC59_03280, partial [Salibacteraceae bacterium]